MAMTVGVDDLADIWDDIDWDRAIAGPYVDGASDVPKAGGGFHHLNQAATAKLRMHRKNGTRPKRNPERSGGE